VVDSKYGSSWDGCSYKPVGAFGEGGVEVHQKRLGFFL
jgi:hypothetical protein